MKYVVFVLGSVFMVYEIVSLIITLVNRKKEKSNTVSSVNIDKKE